MRIFLITKTFFKELRSGCQKFLDKHPYTAQIFPTSLLMAAGDLTGQILVERRSIFTFKKHEKEYSSPTPERPQSIDLNRTLTFACLGVAIGPFLRLWYGKLDKVVAKQDTKLKKALLKMCMDQMIFDPIFIAVFTYTLGIIQGMSSAAAIQRVKDDYFTIIKTNYCLWPAAQLINFYLVPLNFQVIYVQFVALLWNMYLSLKLSPEEEGKGKS